ncbi:MAG: penicillin acylase family protein, partial [Myxococcota bacterium]
AEDATWGRIRTAPELPFALNPAAGYLASANNLPTRGGEVPVGFFFSPDQRIGRLDELLGARDAGWDLDAVRDVHGDTFSSSSADLRDAMVEAAALLPEAPAALVEELRAWDGRYDVDSRGAVAFELAYKPLAEAWWRERLDGDPPSALVGAFGTRARLAAALREASVQGDDAALRRWLRPALREAAESPDANAVWGDLHRLRIQHPFAALPIVGRSYRFVDAPVPGAVETVWKSAHEPVEGEHVTSFGAQARFVSDLSDLDANHVVILGGQDGWLGSPHAVDQVEDFLALRYLPLPLRPETARANAVATLVLRGSRR